MEAIGITSDFMCSMTNISSSINKISLSFPLFAIISFFANLIFMFFNSLFFLQYLLKGRSSHIDEEDDDLLLDEE